MRILFNLGGWCGVIASVFAVITSLLSFQILPAMGFAALGFACYFVALVATE
jgi:hypothetical protein